MTRDEQAMITEFVTRVANDGMGQPQPPIDPEADAIIRALYVRNPAAAYRMTLLAIAQAQALQSAHAQLAAPRPGFWQRLFGGGQYQQPHPYGPQPGYGPQQGYGQPYGAPQAGGGFGMGGFGSALGTGLGLGAGVALGEDLVRDVFGGGAPREGRDFDQNQGNFDQASYDQGSYDQANFDQSGGDFTDDNNNDWV